MADSSLYDIADDLLDNLSDGEGWVSDAQERIVAALQEEGDRRAAEMRERAACEAGLYDVAIAATIRTLPLSPEEEPRKK